MVFSILSRSFAAAASFLFHCLPIIPRALALRELEVVGNQPLQALKRPEENPLGFGFHLFGKVRIIYPSRRLFPGSPCRKR